MSHGTPTLMSSDPPIMHLWTTMGCGYQDKNMQGY